MTKNDKKNPPKKKLMRKNFENDHQIQNIYN